MRAAAFLLASLAVLTPAALAQDDFFGRTVGSLAFDDADPPVLTGHLEQFVIKTKGPAVFESLLFSFTITQHDQGDDDLTGTFTFFGTDPANSLSGSFEGINFPNDDGIWTGVGSWTASTGTGDFAGLSGQGTFTTAFFIDDASAATAFDGTIVPAPSAGALLPLVLLAARRRRR
jgi:hypothetical protein